MRARTPFLILLAALFLTAFSLSLPLFAAEQVATLEPDDTAVTFYLEATGHDVEGKLYLRSGEIRLDPATGLAAGELVIDATRAESGSKKRDKTMHRKVLESEQHPWITFKAERYEGELAASGASTLTLAGTMSLLDVDHPFSLPLEVEVEDGRFTAHTSFEVPYVEWGLENPSFAFLRVAKVVDVKVDAQGTLTATETMAEAVGSGRP